jgi:trehalose 6-phosphate phosphatase
LCLQTGARERDNVQTSARTVCSAFFEQVAAATQPLLLLDYDGTLAPFQVDRHSAHPYPGVVPLLENIISRQRSRVVVITGRPIAELQPLLFPLRDLEIWGSHGLEHLSADGAYCHSAVSPGDAALLSDSESWLSAAGLGDRIEIKPGGVAVHWRGLPAAEIERIQARACEGLTPYSKQAGLKLLEFDGGLELRIAHSDKGDALASILASVDPNAPVAYLGDDITDESAFSALNSRGITILVRSEYRETNAQIWLRPPDELISFLEQWLHCLET